jgi:hypothetical protein
MAPLHYLLAPDVQLLYAQGISRFLTQQLGLRVLINPPPKNTKIKVHYLSVKEQAGNDLLDPTVSQAIDTDAIRLFTKKTAKGSCFIQSVAMLGGVARYIKSQNE